MEVRHSICGQGKGELVGQAHAVAREAVLLLANTTTAGPDAPPCHDWRLGLGPLVGVQWSTGIIDTCCVVLTLPLGVEYDRFLEKQAVPQRWCRSSFNSPHWAVASLTHVSLTHRISCRLLVLILDSAFD